MSENPWIKNPWNAPNHGPHAFSIEADAFRKRQKKIHEIPAKPADISGAFKPLSVGNVTFNNTPESSSSGSRLTLPKRFASMILFAICTGLTFYFGAVTESWLVGIFSGLLLFGALVWVDEFLQDDIGEIVDDIILGTMLGTGGTAYYLTNYMLVSMSWQRALIIASAWAVALTVGYLIYRRLMRKRKFARAVHIFSEGCRYSLFLGMAGFVAYELHVHGVF
jgi:hypothetical protein